jgi:hypothetical protein
MSDLIAGSTAFVRRASLVSASLITPVMNRLSPVLNPVIPVLNRVIPASETITPV